MLAITNAQSSDAGPYHLVVTNVSGSVTSSVAMLRVLVPSRIENIAHGDSTLTFSISTLTNLSYTVEFKDTLDDPVWTALQTFGGTGDVFSITNFTTNSMMRFFRLRIE